MKLEDGAALAPLVPRFDAILKLDLGAGPVSPPGFVPLGQAHGSAIFPLRYAAASVDEIRASHVLEHFPHGQIGAVLTDWARVLKPGGRLRIAVPDFAKIAEGYLAGQKLPTEGYVMGGQVDAADYHKALFDADRLKLLLAGAGLVLIRPWVSEIEDCAALPISLNLEGVKPFQPEIGVVGCMSIPRLAFAEHARCAFDALPSLRIGLTQFGGAYWGQGMERCIETVLAERHPDAILTLDYDTVFTRTHLATLMQLMMVHPEADAIAPLQAGRGKMGPLFTIDEAGGKRLADAPRDFFAGDLARVSTAHFGLTLFRAAAFAALPKPWFHDVPSPRGDWGDGHTDADIAFWRNWTASGRSLFLANRIAVGHLELGVTWPAEDLTAIHQPIGDWRETGTPQGIWQ